MNSLQLYSTEIPGGVVWNPYRAGYCFNLIRKGGADFVCAMQSQHLSAGDVVVLRPGCTASFRTDQQMGMTLSYFYFFPHTLEDALNIGEKQFLEQLGCMGPNCMNFYPAKSAFARLFVKMAKEVPNIGNFDNACKILQLVAAYLRERNGANTMTMSTQNGDVTKTRIAEILSQMQESELETISIDELARKCGCCRRHLARVFQEHFGDSVGNRKMELRLQKAAYMLKTTNSKVIDIAMDCGFSHLGPFSTKFKDKFGATPAKWRQQQLEPNVRNIIRAGKFEMMQIAPMANAMQ